MLSRKRKPKEFLSSACGLAGSARYFKNGNGKRLLALVQRLENLPVKLQPFRIQLLVIGNAVVGHTGHHLILMVNLQPLQQFMQLAVFGQQPIVFANADTDIHPVANLVHIFLDQPIWMLGQETLLVVSVNILEQPGQIGTA